MVDLKGNPFFLDEAQEAWVHSNFERMSVEDKLGQIFCETIWNCNDEEEEMAFRGIRPGGIMFRGGAREELVRYVRRMSKRSSVPLLFSGNFECGGNGVLTNGTFFGSQMQVAATEDVRYAELAGSISAKAEKWAATGPMRRSSISITILCVPSPVPEPMGAIRIR